MNDPSNQQTKRELTAETLRGALAGNASSWQIAPAIDHRKLDNALSSYGTALVAGICADTVLALYDETWSKSGKRGALITRSGIAISHTIFTGDRMVDGIYIPYEELKAVSVKDNDQLCLQTHETFRWACVDAKAIAGAFNATLLSSPSVVPETKRPPDATVPEESNCVEKQDRNGLNVWAAVARSATKMLIAGIGGGVAFLTLDYAGCSLRTFPDFKRLDTQGVAWYWIFLFGFLTGLAFECASMIRKKP